MSSSGTLRWGALVRTDVSEEGIASIIRVTRTDEPGTTLTVASNRSTLRKVGSYKSHTAPHSRGWHSSQSLQWKPQILHSINQLGSVAPVSYELGFYVPGDDILHSHRRENLKSFIDLSRRSLQRRRNVKNGVFWDVTPCGSCKNRRFRRNLAPPSSGSQRSVN
jgi:hypothetical protein